MPQLREIHGGDFSVMYNQQMHPVFINTSLFLTRNEKYISVNK